PDCLAQWVIAQDQPSIDVQVILGHSTRRKAFLENAANPSTVETGDRARGLCRLFLVGDDETGETLTDDFRNRASAKRDHRRPTSHGLDHCQTERLGPGDREQQGCGSAEEPSILIVGGLAEELESGWLWEWRDDLIDR